MATKRESYFWTSYSDLMTSLFLIMLVLFALVIVLLHNRMKATEEELQEIKTVQQSTQDLSAAYFTYRPDYKKYVLKYSVQYPSGLSLIEEAENPEVLPYLRAAGEEIKNFLKRHHDTQYLLIIEGQASRDNYKYNYGLSYGRALDLVRYWQKGCGIVFGDNCEIQIAGSGDGMLRSTDKMREPNEVLNQRFLIHIIPKNIIEPTPQE